jgi:Zn-dependent M28 family amino/carboxypeptidase
MWRSFLASLLLLALVLGCSERERSALTAREEAILGAAKQVDADRLYAHVAALSGIHSRWMHYDPGTAATINWLLATLAAQGTAARTDSFTFHRTRDIHTANVVVDFPGHGRPAEFILIGAHWDTTSYPESWFDSTARAPGAIDNASGVAALLELARVLADRPLERSVQIIFFAGEEIGFKGSTRVRDYWEHEAGPDSLVCLINVDMLGSDPDLPDANMICDTLSAPLAAAALPWAQLAGSGVALDTMLRTAGNPGGSSDHLPFWYHGLPAFFLHEGPDDASPLANSMGDSLPALQVEFLTQGTRALVGAVMHLAEPLLP